MCTLAAFLGQSARHPLVIAANRDEFLRRPSLPPTKIRHEPWIVAGVDLEAGGTWLGVNGNDLVVGLLNRRTEHAPDPGRRSRGILCLETLACRDGASALDFIRGTRPADYNAYNLLVAWPEGAFVAQNVADDVRITALERGTHVLTNLDVNDPTCPRVAKSHGLFRAAAARLDELDIEKNVDGLRQVLSDHSTPLDPRAVGLPDNLCVHRGEYGTRSSSVLIYDARLSAFRFFHADGAPCVTAYVEVPLPAA